MNRLTDMFGRTVGDLRISVTDRCNFRCSYCIPEEYCDWLPRDEILSFEELTRLVRLLHGRFGVGTVRVTGGEPLMRKELHLLVRMIRDVSPDLDLSMTTNAFFLGDQAQALADAGLGRINVSLDSLQPERFARLTRRDGLEEVLGGIRAAKAAGLDPIKINCVVMRGENDDEILDLVSWGRDEGYVVRFIEYMPLDGEGRWSRSAMVPRDEILQRVAERFPFEAVETEGGEPATRYRFGDGRGGFGVIASVTEPFCSRCDRIRITADGQLRTCLFSVHETDLRGLLRSGADDDELAELFRAAVLVKERGHDIGSPDFVQPDRAMVSIGG